VFERKNDSENSYLYTMVANRVYKQDAVLSQGVPRDAAANFGTYQSFQRHWAVFTAITTLSS